MVFHARRFVAGPWDAFLLAIPYFGRDLSVLHPGAFGDAHVCGDDRLGGVWVRAAAAFALGRSVPIILGAWAVGWLESLGVLTRWQKAFEIAGALVLIGSGAYLINEYFFLM